MAFSDATIIDNPRHLRAAKKRLTRAQRANVSAMVLTSQLLQVLVVSIGVGVFFVVVGTVTAASGGGSC